jgi:hypothetical protein
MKLSWSVVEMRILSHRSPVYSEENSEKYITVAAASSACLVTEEAVRASRHVG